MKKSRKQKRNLQRRQSDFDNNIGRLNEALRRGFTRPGSNKK